MKIFSSLVLLSLFVHSHIEASSNKPKKPYKIMIAADKDAVNRANQFKIYLLNKPPFNRMGDNLVIEIVPFEADELNCANTNPDSPRIITCDTELINKTKRNIKAHAALAFTSKASGGAGGDIAVASIDYPIQTMFHELLHTYGLADEYDYSDSEKTVYCQAPRSSNNIVYFKDKPPYKADADARSKHADDVHWMGQIPTAQLITSGTSLGSASLNSVVNGQQNLGLFRGGSCDGTLPGWRPYYSSIMREYKDDTIYPLYEDIIIKNIQSSIGRKINLPPPEPKCSQNQETLQTVNTLGSDVSQIIERIPHPHNHKH